jgi:hypothetical protein
MALKTTRFVVNNDRDTSIYTDLRSMEKLWAKELYELNANDRERINDTLHGASVSKINADREEGWSEQQYLFYLNIFQIEIDTKIRPQDKQTYLKGVELRSSHIMSPDFRLGFFRS